MERRTSDHHDLDAGKTKGTDSLAYTVFGWVLERDQADEAIVLSRVTAIVLVELRIDVVLGRREKRLGASDDAVTPRCHVLDRRNSTS